jgi:hypothetical protein
MLRFFRFNDPYRLLFVLAFLLVVGLSLFTFSQPLTLPELKYLMLGEMLNDGKRMYLEVVDHTPPLYAWLSGWIDVVFGRNVVARHVVALVLIFFAAAYFSAMLINNKAYKENTYLPAFIFAILCCCSFDFFQFSPQLVASLVLLFALNNLLKEIEFRVQRDETVFNLGLFIGIASLMVFTYWIFLLGAALILVIFSRISFRKIALLFVGFLLPHGMLLMFYWYGDYQYEYVRHFYAANFWLIDFPLIDAQSLGLIALVPCCYFLFSQILLNREARFTIYQSQLIRIMLLWMIVAIIEVFFTRERTPHSFITLVPPLAYFITHYLLLIRRKRLAETMLWLFLLGILGVSWFAKNNRLPQVSYAPMIVVEKHQNKIIGKKVMCLDDDPTIYLHNRVGGFFLNSQLSQLIIRHPEYYHHVLLMNDVFEKDPPEIIVDKNNLMQPFFDRIPKWKKQYVRNAFYYTRLK